jgi:hypothetical protein
MNVNGKPQKPALLAAGFVAAGTGLLNGKPLNPGAAVQQVLSLREPVCMLAL